MTRAHARLRAIPSKVATLDIRSARPEPKRADAVLLTSEHKAFRDVVLKRAGFRCEHVERGQRCTKAAPHDRMVADHIVERADGGAPFDHDNGQCLCVQHNTLKGLRAREARMARVHRPR